MSPFDANSPNLKRLPTVKNPSRLREVTNNDNAPYEDAQMQESNNWQTDVDNSHPPHAFVDGYAAYTEAVSSTMDEDVLGEFGLLARLYTISRSKMSEVEQSFDSAGKSQSSVSQLECRTWDLVQRLYLERTKDNDSIPEVSPGASNQKLVQHLYDTDSQAAETKIILDWLHDGSEEEISLELRSNRWFYTKEDIKSRRRTNLSSSTSPKIVDSLDPDAASRQDKRLAEEDSEYEKGLVRAMYVCVRAGRYAQAADLARQSGEFWRAASLQGCVEHFDPHLDDLSDDSLQPEGTQAKPLWRRMCFALSQQVTFDRYERALYGALCGDINSVLPVLSTWEDRLWIQYNAMNQSRTETHLRHYNRVELAQDFPISDYGHLTPQVVLEGLLQSDEVTISTEARAPLRVLQARLITNQIDVLLKDVRSQLLAVQRGASSSAGSSPDFIRVVVHLIFVLRKLAIPLPEDSSNAVIQAYVEILTMFQQADAIALYASQLPPSDTVEALARYLVLVEKESDRKHQLQIAQRLRLDTSVTILRTIELVFERILSDFALGEGIRSVSSPLEAEEEQCIRALEWLNLDSSLQLEAVVLGNNLFRKLLLSGRASAAKVLAVRMPDTNVVPIGLTLAADVDRTESTDTQMRNAIEYVGYCTMVKALTKYEDWKTLVRDRPQEVNGRRDPIGLRQWKSDVGRLRTECLFLMKEILSSNWCDAIGLGITDQIIVDEMHNLRTMYIPDIVLKMHGVLAAHEGRDVAAVMELAVQVSEQLVMPMKQSGLLSTYVSEVALLGAYLA